MAEFLIIVFMGFAAYCTKVFFDYMTVISKGTIVDRYYLIQQWGKAPGMPDGFEFHYWRPALYNGRLARFDELESAQLAAHNVQFTGVGIRIVRVTEELIHADRKARRDNRAEHTHRDAGVQESVGSYRP